MPRQNRVTPFGEILALPQRGAWMGNRGGCLHDDAGRLGRARWKTRAWLICKLEYKGWHRDVMQPGLYTELFFFDEATALAAGHRPCALCRRDDFNRFRDAVAAEFGGTRPGAVELDRRLHADRLAIGPRHRYAQLRSQAKLGELPDGSMVVLPESADAWLLWQGELHRWTPSGYAERAVASATRSVAVVTPAATCLALAGGYTTQVDRSVSLEC